jgi:hypothetical protein
VHNISHRALPTAETPDWTLAEVIDFEHFLPGQAAASPLPPQTLAALQAAWPEPRQQRRAVLLAWVRQQQAAGPEGASAAASPGRAFAAGLAGVSALATGTGLLAGMGMAGGWLANTGASPVNAPLFWVMTVGWQIALVAVLLLGLAWRAVLARGQRPAAPGWLQGAVRSLALAWAHAVRGLSGERRDSLRAAVARTAAQAQAHGPLLASATLAPLQRFGVALNAGLLLATLTVHLLLVDLRFGWQSTYPVAPEQVHGAVQALALPWRAWLPQAQPTLAEVTTTRFSPGQPASQLPAEAARAWWPFLVASIVCYGLLLRTALLGWTRWLHRHQLAALAFDQPEAMALWRRLCGKLFETQGDGARLAPLQPGAAAGTATSSGPCVLLLSDDLTMDADTAAPRLQRQFGWVVQATHRLPLDDRHAASAALDTLRSAQPRPVGVAVLAPAERDPIVAVAQCLRAVLDAAGPGVETRLLLQGASPERLQLWQRFLQIQRLPLGLDAWAPE